MTRTGTSVWHCTIGAVSLCLLCGTVCSVQAEDPPAQGEKASDLTVIAFMGDTMLGRLVSDSILHNPPTYFWGNTLPLLLQCDSRILNLETTITTKNTRWTKWNKAFYYKAVPQAIQVLQVARIDYVNLANNHILDFSELGLKDTVVYLDQAGIRHTGADFSLAQAMQPVILQAGRVSLGVFSFSDHYSEWDVARRPAGIFYISVPPSEAQWRQLQAIIHDLKERAVLVVLSVHWGPNMRDEPSAEVQEFACRLLAEGVDLIHGHSAHVFHGVEVRGGNVILYDTGEFIDDYAVIGEMRNDYSFLYRVYVRGKNIEQVELIPVFIHELQVNVATTGDRVTDL